MHSGQKQKQWEGGTYALIHDGVRTIYTFSFYSEYINKYSCDMFEAGLCVIKELGSDIWRTEFHSVLAAKIKTKPSLIVQKQSLLLELSIIVRFYFLVLYNHSHLIFTKRTERGSK